MIKLSSIKRYFQTKIPSDSWLFQVVSNWTNGVAFKERSYTPLAKEGYNQNELIYACIKEIRTSASDPPLTVYDGSDPEATDAERLPDHPLQALLRHPNPLMSRTAFIQAVIVYLKIAGDAFIEKERDNRGRVVGLWPLRPDRVEIQANGDYIYTNDATGRRGILFEDMVHILNFNPLNDWYGLSEVAVASRAGDNDNAVTSLINRFFNNSGMPVGLLKTKQRLEPDERERIRDRYGEQYGGVNSGKRIMVLDADASFEAMGLNFDEMQFDSLDARNEVRICMVFGVPPILVGAKAGLDHSTFSNYGEARRSFWDETIIPLDSELAAAFTMWLAEPDFGGVHIRPDYSKVRALQEDRSAKFERSTSGYNSGWLMQNDARNEAGFEPVSGGDAFKPPPSGLVAVAQPADKGGQPGKAQAPFGLITHSVKARDPDDPQGVAKDASESSFEDTAMGYWRRQFQWLQGEINDIGPAELASADIAGLDWQQQVIEAQAAFGPEVEAATAQAVALTTTDFISIGVGFDEAAVNEAAAKWAARHGAELARGITKTTRTGISTAVSNWIDMSGDFPALVSRLDEILNNPNRAELIASTEVTNAYAEGNRITWDGSNVVKNQRWLTARDELVCPICGPLHNKIVGLGVAFASAFALPAAHPRCRCWVVPVIDTPKYMAMVGLLAKDWPGRRRRFEMLKPTMIFTEVHA